MKDESQLSRADLIKEIVRLKAQRTKLKKRIEEITDAADAFVFYVTGFKVNDNGKQR